MQSTGKVVDANPFLLDLLGYSQEDILGKELWEIGLFRDIAASKAAFLELQNKGYMRYEDLPLETDDGRRIDVEFVSNVYEVNGQQVIQCNIRDITQRKLAERALQASEIAEREQRILAESLRDMAAALISTVDIDAVMQVILENMAQVVPHDAANIMLIEADEAHVVYWRGYPPEIIPLLEKMHVPLASARHLQQMLSTRSSYLISHTDQAANWVPFSHTAWVKSYVAAPIRSRDNIIGFINLDSSIPGFFTQDSCAAAASLCRPGLDRHRTRPALRGNPPPCG